MEEDSENPFPEAIRRLKRERKISCLTTIIIWLFGLMAGWFINSLWIGN